MKLFIEFYRIIRSSFDVDFKNTILEIQYEKYTQLFYENVNIHAIESDFELAFQAMIFTITCSKLHNEKVVSHLNIDGKQLCHRILQTTQIDARVYGSMNLIYSTVEPIAKYSTISTDYNFTFQVENIDEILELPSVKAFIEYQNCL